MLWPAPRLLGLPAEHEQRDDEVHRLVAIVQLEPWVQYDQMLALSPSLREQYNMWRQVAPDVDPVGALHFYRVLRRNALPQNMPDEILYGQRVSRRSWMQVPEYAGAYFNSLVERGLPDWITGMPRLAAYMPYGFAYMVADGRLSKFALLTNFPSSCQHVPLCPARAWAALPPEEGLDAEEVLDDMRDMAELLPRDALGKLCRWVAVMQADADAKLPRMRLSSAGQELSHLVGPPCDRISLRFQLSRLSL